MYFPPFAEELNKSRRMVSMQARQFCHTAYAVLIVDLFGTGDSEGNFGDTDWEILQNDMCVALRWLQDVACAVRTFLVSTLCVSSVRLKFRTTKVSLIGRVDKRSASTIPAYFGGCAALIHPTKKTPCSNKPHGYMTLKSESTQGILCPKYKPYKLFQGFSPILTGHH